MGGVRNGVLEEDPGWDLNKMVGRHVGQAQCRTLVGPYRSRGVKGLLLAGHEEVPHGFGLRTGDLGDTAVGAGNHGRPIQLSID